MNVIMKSQPMSMYKLFLLIIFLCGINPVRAQSGYLAGSSSVCIEPENQIFSVALAGYASPKAGRFSISWKYICQLPKLSAVTGLNGKLYAITESNEFLLGTIKQQSVKWKSIGTEDQLTSITGLNNKLYAVTRNNELLVGTPKGPGVIWKKTGKTNQVICLTGLDHKLYAVNVKHELLVGNPFLRWGIVAKTWGKQLIT
ncbi:MAG: hypothetical protein AB2L24_02485 [Mangrovibacterium sp.]